MRYEGYYSTTEAAEKLGLTTRRIQQMCKNGEIRGATQFGSRWYVPSDFLKGQSVSLQPVDRKALPIGVSDYKKAAGEYYYIDKTLLIKDFLDTKPQVSLFTRPRRFGKTLNMDMMRTFFEKTDSDTSIYFKDKKIWSCGEKYTKEQGKYPIIFITLKDVKFETWKATLSKMKELIAQEFARHRELKNSDKLNDYDATRYNKIVDGTADDVVYESALEILSRMLHDHHGVAPIIIIDEYDVPIQQGHFKDFYNEAISFLRNFFSAGLKDNPHLSFALLTGILRVSKESIFSGLNNIKIFSILDDKFSQYFGFTKDEVKKFLSDYGCSEKYEEVCSWYDGYLFGNTEIFNPWSVINYIGNDCIPQAYWQSTGSNDIIGEILANATPEIRENLELLIQNKSVLSYVDENVIYPEIEKNPSSIYSFLLFTGYLRVVERTLKDNRNMCVVKIPNKEISFVYANEILSKFDKVISQSTAVSIQEAIYQKDIVKLQELLRKFLLETISSFDYAEESFYHGLIIGICAIMNNTYIVESNRESGEGRYDIMLTPQEKDLPGIVIELKSCKKEEELDSIAQKAINQIENKSYGTALKTKGITHILKLGMAFCGKRVKIDIIEE
ncbi:MAG: AAA family ATPase [Clostridia bacterium]|nr:AAA family ATPase [Clostridia bacterium]